MSRERQSFLNSALLAELEIEVWHNKKERRQDFSGYAYSLLYKDKKVGVMFASAQAPLPAEQGLVEKICKALLCEFSGGWVVGFPKAILSPTDIFYVNLGSMVVSHNDSVSVFHSYTPKQLLEKTALKAETWSKLKPILRILKNLDKV